MNLEMAALIESEQEEVTIWGQLAKDAVALRMVEDGCEAEWAFATASLLAEKKPAAFAADSDRWPR